MNARLGGSIHGCRGLSLLDAMAAVGILSALCVAAAWLVGLDHRTDRQAAHRIQAARLAQSCIEHLSRHPEAFDEAGDMPDLPDSLDPALWLPGGSLRVDRLPASGPRPEELILQLEWQGPGKGRAEFHSFLPGAAP